MRVKCDHNDVDALVEEIRGAARNAEDAALRSARALELVDRTGAQREAGFALVGDLANRLDLSPRKARELLDLGRAMRRYPGLEEAIRSRRIGLTKAIVAAAAMVESPMPLSEWVKQIRGRDVGSLRGFVRRERHSRVIGGRRLQRELLSLTPEGRAMLFDAQARMSRLRVQDGHSEPQASMRREEAIEKAVHVALQALEGREGGGAAVGERRYRIAEHAPGSFEIVAGRVGDELVLLRAERASFRLEVEAPANMATVLGRLRARHGIASDDPLAIIAEAMARGGPGQSVYVSEVRPLAFALVAEVRAALAAERDSWHRIARILVVLDDLGVPDWRAWVADEIDRSPSVVSELLACGRVARRFPVLDEALRTRRVSWTHVRTLAPHLSEDNIEKLAPLILECSVRELEELRGVLDWPGRPGQPGRREATKKRWGARSRELGRLEFDLTPMTWQRIEKLARRLERRLGRAVSAAEAIEEALWQFLLVWGAPAPLWKAYRIVVHVDRGSGFSWMVGPGGIVQVLPSELERIRGGDAIVCDVAAEVEAVRRRELDRAARALSGMSEEEALIEELGRAMAMPGRPARTDDVVRRAVYLRDGCRCSVCQCRAALYVEVHHRRARAAGGDDDPDNLTVLCTRCHAVAHSNHGRLVPRERLGTRIFSIEGGMEGDDRGTGAEERGLAWVGGRGGEMEVGGRVG